MISKTENNYGQINISKSAIASLTGAVVSECYGIVGMASKQLIHDGVALLLKKDNYSKGVVVRQTEKGIELDIYIVVCYGIKIIDVVSSVQMKVKYELENAFDIEFKSINVFVQGVKVII